MFWSDKRITEWVHDHWQDAGSAEAIGKEMRDEYETRLSELAQELAHARHLLMRTENELDLHMESLHYIDDLVDLSTDIAEFLRPNTNTGAIDNAPLQ